MVRNVTPVSADRHTSSGAKKWYLAVWDDGPGIAPPFQGGTITHGFSKFGPIFTVQKAHGMATGNW